MAMFYFWVVILIVLEFGISFDKKVIKPLYIPICKKTPLASNPDGIRSQWCFYQKFSKYMLKISAYLNSLETMTLPSISRYSTMTDSASGTASLRESNIYVKVSDMESNERSKLSFTKEVSPTSIVY